ncbi:hypothetical protein VNI00_015264 [Paramarasmius palmivorus]|uniref:Uncharacterized protein n=1 Tax=Paramarasmius palmivorus TaxID=297713 RepID=A0AAW0BMV3_9AGAR
MPRSSAGGTVRLATVGSYGYTLAAEKVFQIDFYRESISFHETVFDVLLPCHQEFFNRLVDKFPRTSNGLIGTISRPQSLGLHALELMMLRNIADYPIHVQRQEPGEKLLTTRFRSNVALLGRSMRETLPYIEEDDARAIECPDGESADEQDFSGVHDSSLWAGEVVRLLAAITPADQASARPPSDLVNYNTITLNWMYTVVANLLEIDPLVGTDLQIAANTRE